MRTWERYRGTDELIKLFKKDNPSEVGSDTETTGLHIIFDRPFLIVFGWIVNDNLGRVFTFAPIKENMELMYKCCAEVNKNYFWNVKYDMHMLTNGGFPYPHSNLSDGMFFARLSLNADDRQKLALKSIAKRFVDSSAHLLQDDVKSELSKLRKERNKVLYSALKQFGWTKKQFDAVLKDITAELPSEIQELYDGWKEEYPEPTYAEVKRELMYEYASNDVIIMLEFIEKAKPVIKARKQESVIDREERLIRPLYEMERVGMKVDKNYLEKSKVRVREYIRRKRTRLCELAKEELTVGQHARIKQLLEINWGLQVSSVDEASLRMLSNKYDGTIKEFCSLIIELRTLEKWYSTYILRILENSKRDGRAYTSIYQAGAVTGRVSCDFQQFPKDVLRDDKGTVLYEPRRAFVVTGGEYNKIYYLDYSQIELRCQADYTYKISGGDVNLCQAYMPFLYKSTITGEMFDPKNKEHLKRWNSGEWGDWTPTDVHGSTTSQAFPNLDPSSDEFKKLRSVGKTVNFAKNYGSGLGGIKKALKGADVSDVVVDALNQGYYKAFPKVIEYQQSVINVVQKRGYVQNQYGRRYYITHNDYAYKFCNYLIQGSCADMLKEKIIEIHEFLKPYKTRFQMNIHDELSFEVYKGEEYLIPKIQEIMQDCDWMNVPVVADLEMTTTSWADKEEIEFNE